MSESATESEKRDLRGCRPGAGVVRPAHGGCIGNPAFVPTEEQRREVRALAQIFPPHAQHHIAARLGIDQKTLRNHFRDDLARGRADMLAAVGAQMIKRALEGPDAPGVKGDPEMQKFIMARLGGWGRVEITGRDGGPIETIDLSRLNADQLRDYGRLAAIAEGLDPDVLLLEYQPGSRDGDDSGGVGA